MDEDEDEDERRAARALECAILVRDALAAADDANLHVVAAYLAQAYSVIPSQVRRRS